MAEKRGKLVGGSATEEVIKSSRKVLAPNRGGTNIGLQQYYTPRTAAEFIAAVTGTRHNALDLTAGDGALLAPYGSSDGREHFRWGVEIDIDQINAAVELKRPYRAIHGDIQHVYPLMRGLGLQFRLIVANPPFGLDWEEPSLGKGSSTLIAVRMMLGLLAPGGMGILIAGQARFAREVEPELGDKLCAVVAVERLFPGTKEPCVISFFRTGDGPHKDAPPALRLHVEGTDALSGLTQQVVDAIDERSGYWGRYGTAYGHDEKLADAFVAIQFEHRARLAERQGKPAPYFLRLEGGRVRAQLSAYQRIKLAAEDRSLASWVEGFDRQSPAYFAMQEKQWGKLVAFAAAHEMKVDPALLDAVTDSLKDTRRAIVPLYPLPAAQRLGYLEDIDNVLCTTTDAGRGFEAGKTYPINCTTDVLRAEEMRTRKVMEDGCLVDAIVPVEVSRKAMRIVIGKQTFTEGPEDMAYLLGHFQVPNPGDVATSYPQETAFWNLVLDQVEAEIRRREPGFRYRSFQREDLARLLFKGRGGLAWEQGLGKALGLGSYARALEIAGLVLSGMGATVDWAGPEALTKLTKLAGKCRGLKGLPPHRPDALFIQPQYLVQQFQDEMLRFFGRELVRVGCLGRTAGGQGPRTGEHTALELRDMLHRRQRARRDIQRAKWLPEVKAAAFASVPAIWAVTWYEAISVSQRVAEEAPRVPVHRRVVVTEGEYNRWTGKTSEPSRTVERIYSNEACPACGADFGAGWDGEVCQASFVQTIDGQLTPFAEKRQAFAGLTGTKRRTVCGYVHRSTTRKAAYSVLAPLFDVVGVDEATKIQGDDSLTSQAVHAFQPTFRVFSTGTPIKSFVHQSFRLLGWALGYGTARFPYDHGTGKQRFVDDFSVVEHRLDEAALARGHKVPMGRPKILPDVSNLLRFWRLVAGAIARRRKADVTLRLQEGGAWNCPTCQKEHIADVSNGYAVVLQCACGWVGSGAPPLTFHPIRVPWGKAQARAYQHWLNTDNFVSHFQRKHPASPLQSEAMIELFAPAIGQLAKLRWASVLPDADPDLDLFPDYRETTPGLSAYTPGLHRALQEIVTAVKAGKKVLFGSALVKVGPWICERLAEMGISATHITTEDAEGNVQTLPPMKRAKLIADVQAGKYDVLCVGTGAVAFGYNLQMISEAVVYGLPWDMSELLQFLARIDRLTSQWPINVRIIFPGGSLEERIWGVQKAKGDAADLALDAKIGKRQEKVLDTATLLRELQKKGLKLDGSEVEEAAIEALWKREVKAGRFTRQALAAETSADKKLTRAVAAPRRQSARTVPVVIAAPKSAQVQTSLF